MNVGFIARVLQLALPVLLAAIASMFELRTTNIPNALTVGAGMVAIMVVGALDREPTTHLLGFGLGALAFLTIYRTHWLGGGSVKLGIAISTILGPWTGALFIGLFGAFFGVLYLLLRRRPDAVVPGAPTLLTAVLVAEVAAQWLRPLLG